MRVIRGRFYFERIWEKDESEIETLGRVTPLVSPVTLLLEAKKSESNWFKVKQGSTQEIIAALANDSEGTFHGLGALDQSLRKVKGDMHLEIEIRDNLRFFYAKTEIECTVQEALYHFFGVPIDVIAQPREWFWYHRTPRIIEVGEDRKKVLVEFSAISMWGNSFEGRCLYGIKEDVWGAFVIRPNQSGSVESSWAYQTIQGLASKMLTLFHFVTDVPDTKTTNVLKR